MVSRDDHTQSTGDAPAQQSHDDHTSHVLTELVRRGRERAVLDERTPDEILGYDAGGLPR